MKKFFSFMILLCMLLVFFTGTASAAVSAQEGEAAEEKAAAPDKLSTENETTEPHEVSPDGKWLKEGGEWRFKLSGGEYLENGWVYDSGKWYYLDQGGYMIVGSRKIRKDYYYFRENGEMAIGWVYDEEEDEWYFMDEDGVRTKGWHEADGVWYWFDSKGILFNKGYRMVDGHKYYFFQNGQMAADVYLGLSYYGTDGLRNMTHDMTVQGKRKPTEEEKEAITSAMEGIPGEWMKKCLNDGWEFMFYTDKSYFEAPSTDQGVYYIYHKTDTNYKKIKFTRPESLKKAFGEYLASATGNNKEENQFMADFQQYLADSDLVDPLPSHFDNRPESWFALLFEAYCDTDTFYDIRKQAPSLASFLSETLGITGSGRMPAQEELWDLISEEENGEIQSNGPSADEELKQKDGPASDLDAA